MKKSKKLISVFLALITCFASLTGLSTTAFAAVKEKVCLINLPRSSETNKDGWGHPSYELMNGWKTSSTNFVTAKAVGDYNGNSCYCIEPGIPLFTGDELTECAENFWDNYPDQYNATITPDTIKLYIGRIFQYGWTGKNSVNWVSTNQEKSDECAQYLATQLLVWETVIGERDISFNKIDAHNYNKNNIKEIIQSNHPLRSKIFAHYDDIAAKVKNHTVVPSFAKKSSTSADTFEMKWDGKEYSTVINDSNNVISDYNFSGQGLSFSKSGSSLKITANAIPTDTVKITVSKINSNRKAVITWSDEKIGPQNNQIQDVVTYGETVSDPITAYFNVKVNFGSAKIVKTSEDGKVEGLSFTITGNGVNQTVKTNSKGEMQIDNLMPGVYTVTELAIDKYEPQEVRRVTVVSGQVSTVNFNNVLKRGDLKVIKNSEDKLVEGVTFHLYGTSLSGIAVDEYAVTNANGVAQFKDVLISGSTPYTIEEVDTAIRYVVPATQTTAVEWDSEATRTFNNILKKFTVTVTKSDSEKGLPQGNATLSGAEYGIYKGETLIDSYYTDENGQFTTKEYICDSDWTVREINPSEGYLLDTTSYKVGAEPELYTIEHNQTANDVTEQVIKGNIAIIKHTDNGETQIETPETGAEFQAYLKSAGSYDEANADERDYLTCDENGFAETKNMPYGVYTIHQVKGWDGRELMPDFDVFISQDGATYRYLINNANFESYIKIVKVDAETNKTIPYAGAGFQIYDPDGNLVTMTFTYPTPTTIDTFYTDTNGSLVTPEKLPYGNGYSIVEVQAPYGYVLDSTPVSFDITEADSTEESGVTVIKVDKPNMAQKGTISVEKSGELFFGVSVSGAEGEDNIYQPLYEVSGLPGAKYEIRAAEDIITPDGTLRYSSGELVDTVVTNNDGLSESKEIYLGKYEVKEVEAPNGMVISDEVHTVELVYAGQNVAVTETGTSFVNERQKVEISLEKTLELNELFGIGNNGEIKNITFGLYAAEELVSTSGTSIPKDGLIEIINPNDDGKASFTSDLPIGSYYVKEIATDSHYILDGTTYPVVFEYAGQDTAVVKIAVNDGKAISNNLKYGSVSGIKVDEDGNGIGGAVIGLFKTNDDEFTTENALMTTTSADDGSFSFANIPYGTWYVREISQPTGFVLNETVYDVTIAEDKQIIEISIENTLIRGNITLTKVDADYPDNKLTGAEFEIYKDTNGNDKFDEGDELLGKLSETDTGIYTMNDLVYGHYFVKETKAPDGFILDTGVYSVFIDTDGQTYNVENKAGVGFINEAMKGSLKIVKTSSDGKVEGFSFRVTGANGYDQTIKTDKNGEIFIDGIRIGEYTISEVNDSVSASYMLPADKDATVQVGATTVVQMHNELRDTPKTGDDSNPTLWIVLAAISAVGVATCGIIGFKKKKKKGEND